MTSRRRALAAWLVGLAVLGCLSGCSNDTESYCSTLKDDQKQLQKLAGAANQPGSGSLDDSIDVLTELRDGAPDDISTEWSTLVAALGDLADAVTASGADLGDFGAGKPPPGVSTGQLRAVREAAAELRSTRVQQAGASIEQHARDVCKVDLGGGLGGAAGGQG